MQTAENTIQERLQSALLVLGAVGMAGMIAEILVEEFAITGTVATSIGLLTMCGLIGSMIVLLLIGSRGSGDFLKSLVNDERSDYIRSRSMAFALNVVGVFCLIMLVASKFLNTFEVDEAAGLVIWLAMLASLFRYRQLDAQ